MMPVPGRRVTLGGPRNGDVWARPGRHAGCALDPARPECRDSHDALAGDAALLGDIDLSILGASEGRYDRYAAAIRREHAAFDDTTYRAGRAHVLSAFLAREAIYRTPEIAALIEATARRNIARELDALR